MANPKSASLTAAPFALLARRRFSGFRSLRDANKAIVSMREIDKVEGNFLPMNDAILMAMIHRFENLLNAM